jgi:hypothetical protein
MVSPGVGGNTVPGADQVFTVDQGRVQGSSGGGTTQLGR